jgi:hypothetical protein
MLDVDSTLLLATPKFTVNSFAEAVVIIAATIKAVYIIFFILFPIIFYFCNTIPNELFNPPTT